MTTTANAVAWTQAQTAPAYALLFLPSLYNGAVDQQRLLLPLTLAYLLSAHIAIRFPMPESAMPNVERLFDGILNGLSKDSKGILYLAEASPEQITQLLQSASLVITDEAGCKQSGGTPDVAQAVVCRVGEQAQGLKLINSEKLHDQQLKAKLAGCAQLINVQLAGFVSEGPFSLSW